MIARTWGALAYDAVGGGALGLRGAEGSSNSSQAIRRLATATVNTLFSLVYLHATFYIIYAWVKILHKLLVIVLIF